MRAGLITVAAITGSLMFLALGNAAIDAAPSWPLNIAGPAALIAITIAGVKLLAAIWSEANRG